MSNDLTQLIQRVGSGDRAARDALFASAYAELRKLARSRLYDGGRNTYLDTTALVHESYLRFLNASNLGIDESPFVLLVRVQGHAVGRDRFGPRTPGAAPRR